MERYIALLRGINISGKNKIAMNELKKCFENINFIDVKTYLNSGNVIFSSTENDKLILCDRIGKMISNSFNLDIEVFVILQKELVDILNNAPKWWGNENKEIYDNLIFIISPATFEKVFNEIGEPKAEFEKIQNYKNVVFWSFSKKDYRKTNWWSKTATASISKSLTIRTANTVRKIVEM